MWGLLIDSHVFGSDFDKITKWYNMFEKSERVFKHRLSLCTWQGGTGKP